MAITPDHGWLVAWCECRMCGAEQVAVLPTDVLDPARLECHECGHMTAEATAWLAEDGDWVEA